MQKVLQWIDRCIVLRHLEVQMGRAALPRVTRVCDRLPPAHPFTLHYYQPVVVSVKSFYAVSVINFYEVPVRIIPTRLDHITRCRCAHRRSPFDADVDARMVRRILTPPTDVETPRHVSPHRPEAGN